MEHMLVCGAVDVPAHVLGDVLNDSAVHTDVLGHVQVKVPLFPTSCICR